MLMVKSGPFWTMFRIAHPLKVGGGSPPDLPRIIRDGFWIDFFSFSTLRNDGFRGSISYSIIDSSSFGVYVGHGHVRPTKVLVYSNLT